MGTVQAVVIMSSIAGVLGILLSVIDRYLATYGECRIAINNDEEQSLTVQGGNSLLSYLFDHKIFIPSACGGRATCGLCKLKVLDGGGPLLPTETPFLSKQEIQDDVRLICQIKVKSDVSIYVPEELLAVQQFRTTVMDIKDLTDDTKQVRMKLEDPPAISFKPGQFIQFQIPGTSEFRAYSVASPPSQTDVVEIIVRLVPGGLCTTYIHTVLQVGEEISITGPYGEFFLREDSTTDIICVAGGSGVAPIKSILTHLFEKGTDRKVTYFFGARSGRDLYYYDECLKLAEAHPNFTYVPALSEPLPEDHWTGRTGFIHLSVDELVSKEANVEGYLCGPPPMIDAVIRVLKAKGVKEGDIHFDKF